MLIAIAFCAAGLAITPEFRASIAPAALVVLGALAVCALAPALFVVRTGDRSPVTLPFLGICAAAAVLLALAPLDRVDPETPGVAAFLFVAPWRYALPPLVVHFVLEVGWPQRRTRWIGWVLGWYATEAAMFVVTSVGIGIDERPLVDAVDGTLRMLVLEPAAVVIAVLAIVLALATPDRTRSARRSLGWTFLAIVVGTAPLFLTQFIPELSTPLLGEATPARLLLVALPICTALAVAALPFRDLVRRDLTATRIAVAMLSDGGMHRAVEELASVLHGAFNARGVLVRISDPPTTAAAGAIGPRNGDAPVVDGDAESDGAALSMTIGRATDPLGDVEIRARTAGALGETEREWLAAFLQPIASVLRVRHRELASATRYRALRQRVGESVQEIAQAAEELPPGPSDAGMAVPPPVDAREVLTQLSDGVSGVARHGDGLGTIATETRDRARAASDAIARALDRLVALAGELAQLVRSGEEIAANNDTISGVAFRTNLVANNAALEASRAGVAGRTFAVLAEDVRRLADTTAATSGAIRQHTDRLAAELRQAGAAVEATRESLATAIHEAEAGERSAQQLDNAAGELEDVARSLRPAVAEANAVAARRSARDQHLTATLERFLKERAALTRSLGEHRDSMNRLAESLEHQEQRSPRG